MVFEPLEMLVGHLVEAAAACGELVCMVVDQFVAVLDLIHEGVALLRILLFELR